MTEKNLNKDLKDKINNSKIEAGVPENHEIVSQNSNKKLIIIYISVILLSLVVLTVLGIYLKSLWVSTKKEERMNEALIFEQKKENDIIAQAKQEVEEEQRLITELNNNETNNNIIKEEVVDDLNIKADNTEQKDQENEILQRKLQGALKDEQEVEPKEHQINGGVANFSKINSNFRLGKGKNLTCTLQTKINTTYPGTTSCILSNDVYSDNGNTLLLEKGSIVTGQQKSALINGQARVFIIWEEIKTPNDIEITIDSGSADSLGAPGSAAKVNNHFFKRLGGAILLSMVGETINYAKDVSLSHHQKSGSVNNTNYSGNSTYEITNLAQEILQQNINIPPTGEVVQGTIINIMLAKDLDFSSVYELE